jgi:hypothetical protein
VSPPVCAICAKAKKLYKHKRGMLCARCVANLAVLHDWYAPYRANVIVYLGRVP